MSLVYSKKRVGRLTRTKPTLTEQPSTEHNRTKAYLVDPAAPYLRHLGITQVGLKGERAAQVKPSMYAKYRQICRFVEILDQLLAASELKDAPAPRIVDIGSGKGYLTFALHDHLARGLAKAPGHDRHRGQRWIGDPVHRRGGAVRDEGTDVRGGQGR